MQSAARCGRLQVSTAGVLISGCTLLGETLVPAGGVVPGVMWRLETAIFEIDSAVLNGAVWSRR